MQCPACGSAVYLHALDTYRVMLECRRCGWSTAGVPARATWGEGEPPPWVRRREGA